MKYWIHRHDIVIALFIKQQDNEKSIVYCRCHPGYRLGAGRICLECRKHHPYFAGAGYHIVAVGSNSPGRYLMVLYHYS